MFKTASKIYQSCSQLLSSSVNHCFNGRYSYHNTIHEFQCKVIIKRMVLLNTALQCNLSKLFLNSFFFLNNPTSFYLSKFNNYVNCANPTRWWQLWVIIVWRHSACRLAAFMPVNWLRDIRFQWGTTHTRLHKYYKCTQIYSFLKTNGCMV